MGAQRAGFVGAVGIGGGSGAFSHCPELVHIPRGIPEGIAPGGRPKKRGSVLTGWSALSVTVLTVWADIPPGDLLRDCQ